MESGRLQHGRLQETKVARWLPAICLLVLALVIAVLAFTQFRRERAAMLADIASLTSGQHQAVSSMLEAADQHLLRMRAVMERRIADQSRASAVDLTRQLRRVSAESGGRSIDGLEWIRGSAEHGNLIAVPNLFELAPDQRGPVAAALDLLPLLQNEAAAGSRFSWSYFFSANGDFISIFPGASLQDFAASASSRASVGNVSDLIAQWLGSAVFQLGRPEGNRNGQLYWTEPYQDAGGAGRLISHGMPVTIDSRFLGIVGTDIPLVALAGTLGTARPALGFTAIVGAKGEVLALEGASFDGDTARMSDYLATTGLALDASPASAMFERRDDNLVLVRAVGQTPFRLLYVLPKSELAGKLLPGLIGYGLVFLVAAAALLGMFFYLRRSYVTPGLVLANFSLASAEGARPTVPEVPSRWQAPLAAIARAFSTGHTASRSPAATDVPLAASRDIPLAVPQIPSPSEELGKLPELLDRAPVAILTLDREGCFTLANREAARWLKRRPDEIVGQNAGDLLDAEEAALLGQVVASGAMAVETRHHAPSARYAHALSVGFPLHGAGGEIEGVSLMIIDRTAEVTAQEAAARQRETTQKGDRLAAAGSLLAGIAQELSNPLSVVVGYSQMLTESAGDEPTRRRATEIHQAAVRGARIVKTFLTMVRAQPVERLPVDLPQLVSDVLDSNAHGLSAAGIQVALKADGPLPPVLADADQLYQVLMNVIVNAQQAMSAVEGPRKLSIRFATEAENVVVEIADTGPTLPEEVRHHAFDPQASAKVQGAGAGIGLSVSKSIVTAHGGSITLDRGTDGGTLCRITLPAERLPVVEAVRMIPAPAMGEALKLAEVAVPQDPPSMAGRLLLVELDTAVAGFLTEALYADGIEVVTVVSGLAALEAARGTAFEAVLSDRDLPDMAGAELAERLAGEHPALRGRIWIMTSEGISGEPVLEGTSLPLLEKPIEIAALRAALLPLLHAREAGVP